MAKNERLAVIICNYNKGDSTINCINSILGSSGFDDDLLKIYVIDNASTDNSEAIICDTFGDTVSFTQSDNDLGSCGGINLGIKKALADGFDYICCLGEEITVEADTLKIMLDYMINNPSTGMLGGKVYHGHMPHYIQQFGIAIDFRHFRASTLYADTADSEGIPNIVYCDAVGSCAMMVSAAAIEKAGFMPEENFIYWDDTEWGFRIKQKGFEVAAIGDAKFHHCANPMRRCDNTKVNYYMTRNCINFFMKYTVPEKCAKMSITLLRSVFEAFYLHRMGHAHNMAQTDLSALNDALNGVMGKALSNRILNNDETGLGFVSFFEERERVYIEDDDPFLEQVIRQINPDIIFMQIPSPDATTIIRCESILGIQDFRYSLDFSEDIVYIDKSYRMLATREDAKLVNDYESNLNLFLYAMQPLMLRRISEIRGIEF